MTDERLKEIKARCEAATPGPWARMDTTDYAEIHGFSEEPGAIALVAASDNADFIGHAREDIPWLLAQLEQVTAERDAAVADIAELLRNCTCEHRNDYCNEVDAEECSGCFPGDCSAAKWRGLPPEAGRRRRPMTTRHVHADIRGMLRYHSRKGSLKGVFSDEKTGRKLSDDEAREYLYDCLAKGWRVLPMCDCDNFDYQTGCKGHPTGGDES